MGQFHPHGDFAIYATLVRLAQSWGIGDFHDLGSLAETLAPYSDFLLINPLHAAEPLPPVEDSPYLPATRRFINPLYLHIEDIPQPGASDGSGMSSRWR